MIIKKSLTLLTEKIRSAFPNCECRRAWAAESSLRYIGSIQKPLISIVPANKAGGRATRESSEMTISVLIGIQKKLVSNVNDHAKLTEEIDPLVGILESLFEMFIFPARLEGENFEAICREPSHGDDAPLFFPDQIFENNLFFGVMALELDITVQRK